MALTAEVIKANEGLNSLSDDQINQIVTLSTNDENTVIGNKTKEIYDRLDADLKEVSGLDKEHNEKTYDFAKRTIGHFKGQLGDVDSYKTQINDLNTKIKDYEKQIKEGNGDAALKQQLADAEDKMKVLQGQYDTLKTDFDKKNTEHSEAMKAARVSNEVNRVKGGLKFKAEYTENVQKVLTNSAIDTILKTNKADFVKEGDSESLVFRDEAGEIMRNPENGLNPFTLDELLKKELTDVLDQGKQQPGGGTKPPTGGDPVDLVDLAAAKTQVEADDLIEKHLLQKGFTKSGFADAGKFQEEFTKIRKANNVDKLPLR
jgi:hypothetical protein